MGRGICVALVALVLVRAGPVQAQDKSEWTFTATPYAWLMGASGNVRARGQTVDVNGGVTDIFGKTDSLVALMANLEPRRDKLVLGLDVVFAQIVGSPMVTRDGTVCAVAFSGAKADDQWLGSRAIAAEKANTANALSLQKFALSTANLYAGAQPAGPLFCLQTTDETTKLASSRSACRFKAPAMRSHSDDPKSPLRRR